MGLGMWGKGVKGLGCGEKELRLWGMGVKGVGVWRKGVKGVGEWVGELRVKEMASKAPFRLGNWQPQLLTGGMKGPNRKSHF